MQHVATTSSQMQSYSANHAGQLTEVASSCILYFAISLNKNSCFCIFKKNHKIAKKLKNCGTFDKFSI